MLRAIIIILVLVVLIIAAIMWWMGAMTGPATAEALIPRPEQMSDRERIIREHTSLLVKAAKASADGDIGQANIYAEGAARLLEELPPTS